MVMSLSVVTDHKPSYLCSPFLSHPLYLSCFSELEFLSPLLIHTCPSSLFELFVFALFRYKSKWPPPCHGYSARAAQGET